MKTKSILTRACLQTLEARRLFNFGPAVDYAAGTNPSATVVADLNGDTRPDIAVANYSSGNVSVLLGNANGTFQAAQNSATGANPQSLAFGDFNTDGKVDLVTANANYVSVLIGNGNGTYHAPVNVDVSLPSSVAVGDFNADGKLDLAVASNLYYPGYYAGYGWYPPRYGGIANVLLGNGSASFTPSSSTFLVYGSSTPNSFSTAVADFNGDGKLDFAVANASNPYVSVLAGTGNGGFTPSSVLFGGSGITSLVAKDVSGDGKADLLVASPWATAVQVALGNGVGGFGSVQNLPTGATPSSVAVADFNTDGKLDLLSTNVDGTISVLLGAGSGTFKPAISLAYTTGGHIAAAGDFNADGRPDVATSNVSTNNVSVRLNDGSWIAITAPSLTIGDASVAEGNTGTTNANFTVSLSAASSQTVTVHYATADGSATVAGGDYVAASGNLTFAPGQTSKTITVPVNGDRVGEANEGFSLRLTDPANAFLPGAIGFGSIVDDEPRITIDASASVTEGNTGTTPMNFTVNLSAAYDVPVTVNYSTAEGDTETWKYDYYYYFPPDPATSGVDFQGQTGTLTFAPGQTAKTIAVLVNGDHTAETNEAFSVDLDTPTGGAVLTVAHALGTIVDDEPGVSITGGSVVEGNSGTVPLTFTATLSAASDVPVTATYKTVDYTAWSTTDYVAVTGTVTFAPGQTTRTFTVDIKGDLVPENTESFIVNLTGATNAHIVGNQAFGTITDTDPDPTISIANMTRSEGGPGMETGFEFILSLSKPSGKTISVNFATATGTATSSGSNKDYYAETSYASFYPGQMFTSFYVYVIGDNRSESDETFLVNLSSPSGATIADNQAVGTILNDETRGKKWIGPATGGNWSTASNWSPSGVPVATSLVNIDGASVTVSASVSVDELSLVNYAKLTVAPNGSRVMRTRAFFMDYYYSTLNLNDNSLIVDYTAAAGISPLGVWDFYGYTGLTAMVGYGSHPTYEAGITTTRPDALAGRTTLGIGEASQVLGISGSQTAIFSGQTVDATTVLVKYTYRGDANLDGRVDVADLGSLATNYGASATGSWIQGDFDFNGAVDVADLGSMATNFGMTSAAASPASLAAPQPTARSPIAEVNLVAQRTFSDTSVGNAEAVGFNDWFPPLWRRLLAE